MLLHSIPPYSLLHTPYTLLTAQLPSAPPSTIFSHLLPFLVLYSPPSLEHTSRPIPNKEIVYPLHPSLPLFSLPLFSPLLYPPYILPISPLFSPLLYPPYILPISPLFSPLLPSSPLFSPLLPSSPISSYFSLFSLLLISTT